MVVINHLSSAALVDLHRRLAQVAVEVAGRFPEVDGAGVTVLLSDGSLYAGSNEFTDSVDDVQYRLGEGPCWAAVAGGHEIRSSRIGAGEPRWPRFSEAAGRLALRSVLSTPLVAGNEVTGSVNLYARSANGLDSIQPRAVERSAEHVQGQLGAARLVALAASAALALAVAVRERSEVDVAIGMLMDRYRIRAGEAAILLDQLARQDEISRATAARHVLGQDG
jgi:GAF domain-containing protein